MIIVGFEGSANKLGIGIVDGEKVLCNRRRTYSPVAGEGFKITDAAMHHQKGLFGLFKECMEESGVLIGEIRYLAYTRGPGIGPCLQVVALFVKVISSKYGIPVIPVNHCVAHIEMGRFISGANNPTILYVSGGNTQIITYWKGKYVIFGETLDIAIGNALDRVARELGLSNYPSPGYNIERKSEGSREYIGMPYCVKGTDVSFSGITSYITNYLKGKELDEKLISSICYSLQETAFSMLIEVTERAMSCTGSKDVLVVGGVGCNRRLQEMACIMARERGGTGYGADEKYCVDNGLMIAHTAYKMVTSGCVPDNSCSVSQRYRTDTVDITWRSD
ncbi:N6-L-threonylcarbamoyladenine synthase [Nematocida sp. LUAm3]|nr:N6-L-threonylcarbamoyladenine synthase [Nematocida sp. LUAm3]KAI5173572.1 N6-L-threonylcarbamoyladenine synthase [Nematocida sp. LUAm2]KAI5176793.1 N6-L-threonylcarbamoyladenine synthase [Nematocida sp. LUAm1]